MSRLPTGSIEKGAYVHSKSGKQYEVTGTAYDTETGICVVVYRPLYESEHELFVRPLSMFLESVVINGASVPRFVKVND